jgi:hypothetical protein
VTERSRTGCIPATPNPSHYRLTQLSGRAVTLRGTNTTARPATVTARGAKGHGADERRPAKVNG